MTRAFLILFLVCLPAAASAAAFAFTADRDAYAADQRVATMLKAISDSRRFDEDSARRLMPVLMVNDLTPEEADLYYEIVTARTPVNVRSPYGPAFQLPPPDGAARSYLGVLKMVLESPNFQMTLDERWLAGGTKMKELVDISTFGSRLNMTMVDYFRQKFAIATNADLKDFVPLKDEIDKVRTQLSQTDIQTEERGKALAYAALRSIDNETNGMIPDDLYADMR